MAATWEEFEAYVQDDRVIREHAGMLQELGVTSIGARDLLACHGMEYIDTGIGLKSAALTLSLALKNGRPTREQVERYAERYRAWKAADQQETLEMLCRLYWEYELILALNEVEEADVAHAREQQAECLRLMRGIDGLAYWRSFSPLVVVAAPEAQAQVYSVLKRAYWDRVRAEAAAGNLGPLLAAFRDMKGMLAVVVGGGRRGSEILAEWEDVFDEAFILQRSVMGLCYDFWKQRCVCMRDILLQVDRPSHDEETRRQCAAIKGLEDCWAFLAYVMDRLQELKMFMNGVH